MSFVIVIASIIVFLLFLLVFTLGFFVGLGRKKKELKLLEKEQEIQKKTQENLIYFFSKNETNDNKEPKEESLLNPIKIISKEYRRIRRILKYKNLVNNVKETQSIRYLRKYFLSYIGIAVLIFGFGYFLKFSLSASNINIYGRFAISVFSNLLIIIISHFIRNRYKTFSSILMGGALGSMYISFTVSFYVYHIFSNIQIFGIFLFLTTFSVALSYFHNRFELLLLAMIAGFTAPLFSNFDFSHSISLFIYIILLDIAAIILSAQFKSFIIRLLPALYTGVYFLLWLKFCIVNEVYNDFGLGFLLVTIIYFILVLLSFLYNIRTKTNFQPYELMMILIINLIYYSVGMYMLNILNPDYKGIFTGITAIFNIVFLIIILLIKKESTEKLIYFFSIISLLFITLIPPVQLVGKSITMIWAVETVLLLWVSLRLHIQMLKLVSTFLMIGLIASFMMDVVDNYLMISANAPVKNLFINKSFVSGIMTSFGLGINVLLINKSQDRYLIKPIKMSHLKFFISIFAIIALYISIYTEILYQLTIAGKDNTLIKLYLGIFNYAFIMSFMIAFLFIKIKTIKIISGIIAVLSVVLFFTVYLYSIIKIRDNRLSSMTITMNEFSYHIVITAIILIIIFLAYYNIRKINQTYKRLGLWVSSFLIVSVLMTELDHFAVIYNMSKGLPLSTIIRDVHIYYYSLFLTLTAFVIAISALIFKDREHARLSIFIILFTLFKLFVFDLSGLQSTQRIVSYISIGSIALFIAFVRQRLFEKPENQTHNIKNN